MTFNEWNREVIERLVRGESRNNRLHIKAARAGDTGRSLFWGDYVEWCEKNNVEPEMQW